MITPALEQGPRQQGQPEKDQDRADDQQGQDPRALTHPVGPGHRHLRRSRGGAVHGDQQSRLVLLGQCPALLQGAGDRVGFDPQVGSDRVGDRRLPLGMLHHQPRRLTIGDVGLDAGDGVVGGIADPGADVALTAKHHGVLTVPDQRVVDRFLVDLREFSGDDRQRCLSRLIRDLCCEGLRRCPDRLEADAAQQGGYAQHQGEKTGDNAHAKSRSFGDRIQSAQMTKHATLDTDRHPV